MSESFSSASIFENRPPAAGDPAFIGPLTEAQYTALERSYLPANLNEHAKKMIHGGVEQRIRRMAIIRRVELEQLSHVEMFNLRRKAFELRLRQIS